jgi:hypothetical protein
MADIRAHTGGGGRATHHVRRPGLLQRPDPRAGDRRGWRASSPASPTMSRSRSNTCASRSAGAPRLRDTLRVHHVRGGVVRRRGAREAGEGTLTRTSSRSCAAASRSASRCRRRSSRSRRGRRSTATRPATRDRTASASPRHLAHPYAIRLLIPRDRGCWAGRRARADSLFRSEVPHAHLAPRRPEGRRPAAPAGRARRLAIERAA